jgi:hypothetical protein
MSAETHCHFYPERFIVDTIGLTIEETGLFWVLLSIAYARGTPSGIEEDLEQFAGMVQGASPERVRLLIDGLVRKRKISRAPDTRYKPPRPDMLLFDHKWLFHADNQRRK